jgi:hypothetical protein
VPETKRIVKSVEDYQASNNARNELYMLEWESYTLADRTQVHARSDPKPPCAVWGRLPRVCGLRA